MTLSLSFSLLVRVTAVFGLSLGAVLLLPRASASSRRLLAAFGLFAGLVLGALALFAPERPSLAVLPRALDTRIFAETPADLVEPAVAVSAPLAGRDRERGVDPAAVLAVFWLAGTALALARLGVGLLRVRRLIRQATPLDSTLAESAAIEGPVVAGVLRPKILLPLAARAWSPERLELVLAHERAHLAARDGAVLVMAELACAAYWFHPLSWLLARRLRRECELLADEAVVRGGVLPSTYAEHLLAVARAALVSPGSIAMAARPSELSRRIHVLVGRERLPERPGRVPLVLGSLAACSALAAAACLDAASAPETSGSPGATAKAPRAAAIVAEEAERARARFRSPRVAVVVVEAATGAVLAEHDDAPGAVVEPASTLKPLVVSLALDAGRVTPESRFDCGDGRRAYGAEQLRDGRPYGELSVSDIVAVSSNVGLSRIFDELGARRLEDGLSSFEIATPHGIEDGSLRGATTAIGHRVSTTPLALARAYSVFANAGEYVAPGSRRRVIGAPAARATLEVLENAVSSERGTGRAAQIPGVRVAGKTGTSDGQPAFASFVGVLPADRPKYVIYVGIAGVDPNLGGSRTAAPVFAQIGRRLLTP